MFGRFIKKGKDLVISPQTSILSAAAVIMVMIIASRVLGLVRQRVLLSFFVPSQLSLFFAAFRLPDLIFEVLTMGTLSSAFIPVFTKLQKGPENTAWEVAGKTINLGLIIFGVLALVFGVFANHLYAIIAPGYSDAETQEIAKLARILFTAQGLFVISYILTGVLESLKRFFIPALAPLFYNIGIIIGTLVFAPSLGLMGPVIGVVFGALGHLLIQLPFAMRLGFRFSLSVKPDDWVKKIGKLALPRLIELSTLQISKVVELFLASIISSASYTYYTLATSVQALPVGLFGLSLAKAALPTLTRQDDSPAEFRKTLLSTLYEIIFLVMPLATILLVLRIPIVRLLFGTNIFDWAATVQTGLVLSTFAIGIPFQSAVTLLARGFYARHNTKTPVKVSLIGTAITVTVGLVLVKGFGYPTWALAAAYVAGTTFQAIMLFYLLAKQLNGGTLFAVTPMLKSLLASFLSGGSMFFILKFFDRAVWVKKLSFLNGVDVTSLNFERFVLDTRYTLNLLILTVITATIGLSVYLLISFLLRSEELYVLINVIRRRSFKAPRKEEEPLAPLDTL